MSKLQEYTGALVNLGTLREVGFFTTITKDPNELGTMGKGVFFGVKFVGKNNRSVAKAFNNADNDTATQLQSLVANAPKGENGRPKTEPVLIEAVAQEQSYKDPETGKWINLGTQLVIKGIYKAPSMTKELWGYSE